MRQIRPIPLFLAVCGAIALPGCSDGAPDKDRAANGAVGNAATIPSHAATANAADPGPGAQAIESKADGLEFSYKWPAEAAAIPELNAWLRGNGDKLLADARQQAKSDQAEAKKNGYPFNGHSYDEGYATVANTPRALVLLSDGYVFTGGAHGMPIATAILWDKGAKKRLATGAVLDIPRLATVAKPRFCKELDAQRAEKRGEPVRHDDPNELDDFVKCVDMTKQLILPISTGGKALDTVRISIGPYEAGPYAEGSYVIDLPMDAALLTTVKPAWKDAFMAAR
ncbi:MAG: DUF4163 domain-containing protein [Sphingobium sp.]